MSVLSRAVIDTNVLSYLSNKTILGERYRELMLGRILCIAFVTPEELYFGAEKKGWGRQRRSKLETLIADCCLLPVNLEIAKLSARLRAERERAGRPLNRADAWIAATALWHESPLVSHDRDFDDIPALEVIAVRPLTIEDPCGNLDECTPARDDVSASSRFRLS